MAHASGRDDSAAQPTGFAATRSVHAKPEDSGGDEDGKAAAVSGAPGSSAVADPGEGQAQPTGGAVGAGDFAAPETLSAGVLNGATVAVIGQFSSGVYLRQAMAGSLAANAGSVTPSIHAGDAQAASAATTGLPTRQDRSKTPAEPKKAAAGVVTLSVADPARLPGPNIIIPRGTVHGQEGGVSENSAKNAMAEIATGAHGKAAAPTDGLGDGTASAASPKVDLAASAQGSSAQTPAQPLEAGLDLSMTSASPANPELTDHAEAGVSAASPMAASSATADSTGYRAPDGPSGTKSGTTVAPGAWHAAGDSPTAQGVPVEASKTTGPGNVPTAGTASGAAQATLQTMLTPMGSHVGPVAQNATTSTPCSGTGSAHAAKAPELPGSSQLPASEGAPATGINSAKLIQTIGETEMHVGMHSVEFGDISIRTSLNQQQMVTQISLDHNDLSQTISSHLSTMQAKLGEDYGLHASIEINNQGAPLSGGQGDSRQREQQRSGRPSSGMGLVSAERSEGVSGVVARSSAGSGHGLDITV